MNISVLLFLRFIAVKWWPKLTVFSLYLRLSQLWQNRRSSPISTSHQNFAKPSSGINAVEMSERTLAHNIHSRLAPLHKHLVFELLCNGGFLTSPFDRVEKHWSEGYLPIFSTINSEKICLFNFLVEQRRVFFGFWFVANFVAFNFRRNVLVKI